MRNFIQPGDTITLKAPSNIASGEGILLGAIFGIACNDAYENNEVEVKLDGVFHLNKIVTEGWNVGGLVYWNESKKLATSEQNNNLIGVAIEASLNPSTIGTVRLNGFAIKTSTYQDKDKKA